MTVSSGGAPWPAPDPLSATIATLVARGCRIEYRDQTQAVLVTGGRTNHVLHGVLSLLTCGLWLLVWLVLILSNRPSRFHVWIGPDGQVQSDRPMFIHGSGRHTPAWP